MPHRIAFTRSIAYAKGARQTLDVCRPKTATAAPALPINAVRSAALDERGPASLAN
jgi:hypothetical protein